MGKARRRVTGLIAIDYTLVEEYLNECNENNELMTAPHYKIHKMLSHKFNHSHKYSLESIKEAAREWMIENTMHPSDQAKMMHMLTLNLGPKSPETRKKISEANKRFYARRKSKEL